MRVDFRAIVESTTSPLVIHRNLQILYANPAAIQLFGVRNSDQVVDSSLLNFVSPMYRSLVEEHIKGLKPPFESRAPLVVKVLTGSGNERLMELYCKSFEFCGEHSILSHLRDITEYKKAEAQYYKEYLTYRILRKLTSFNANSASIKDLMDHFFHLLTKYPFLRETVRGGWFFQEKHGKMELVSCKGNAPDPIISCLLDRSIDCLCHHAVETGRILSGCCTRIERAAPDGDTYQYFFPIKHKNDVFGLIILSMSGPPDIIENTVDFMRTFTDTLKIILEKKKIQSKLHNLSKAVEHCGDAIMITDGFGITEYANPACAQIYGMDAEELQGKYAYFARPENLVSQDFREIWKTLAQGRVWKGTLDIPLQDGHRHEVITSIAPIRDDAGSVVHYVCCQQDITAYNLLKAQFAQAQKMQELGTLAGGIAHDFNNMLAGISGNLYLLKKWIGDNPAAREKLANIEQIVQRAADMIRQLLAFARRDTYRMQRLSLVPCVRRSFKLIRTLIPENIHCELKVRDEDLIIHGDETMIHQILMNLVSNAKDALDGVRDPLIRIEVDQFEPDNSFIEQNRYFKEGIYARLRVTDNGCGIPKDKLEHIFDPFYTTKAQGKGSGLGLAMVFGAVKTHKGFIRVESKEGLGTSMSVYFPLLEEPEKVHDGDRETTNRIAQDGKGELILIADDDEQARRALAEVLSSMGYRVVSAKDGQEAIKMFERNQESVSLALLDVVMPQLSGIRVAEYFWSSRSDLPVIFMTGYDKDHVRSSENLSGSYEILSKPVDLDGLGRMIRSMLDIVPKI